MKKRNITLLVAVVLCGLIAFADNFIVITFTNGTTTQKTVDTSSEQLTFNAAMDSLLFSDGSEYAFSDIAGVAFKYTEPTDESSVIRVTWNGTDAPTVECSASGVTATISGGDVTLTNTNTDTEYTYVLSGTSSAGSFTLESDYKSTIQLNGVNLQSTLEEALNLKCGKRVALEIVDGTTNTLADATTDNGQKAALYCKGHLEISGGGTLNLTGNVKHALSTKEYCQLKKTTGTINITKAVNDGIHAGQYFQMNGGQVTISGVGGDGVQAEITDDTTDEDNGQLIIKGGTLNVTTTADDVSAVKSDSLMTISGGTLTLKCTGASSNGLKSDTDINITDGTITITDSGNGMTVDSESSTSKGISVDNNLYIQGGTVNITMTGTGGKGIKADNNAYIGDEATLTGPTLTISTSGSAYSGTSSSSNNGGGGPGGGGWGGHGGGGGGGGMGGETSGSDAKAIKTTGSYYQYGGDIYITTATDGAEGIESKAATTTAMNFIGGNLYMKVYDDCINSAGQINLKGANVICYSTGNDAIDSNYGRSGAITISGGVVIAFSQKGGAEMGIDCDNMSYVKVTGGTLVAGGGSQGNGSSSSIGSGSTHYKCTTTSTSYTAGKYYSIVCGTNIITWLQPCTVSSSYNVFASDAFTSSTTHTIYYGTTAPTSCSSSADFRDSTTGTAKTMLWKKSDITTGTKLTTFSPN